MSIYHTTLMIQFSGGGLTRPHLTCQRGSSISYNHQPFIYVVVEMPAEFHHHFFNSLKSFSSSSLQVLIQVNQIGKQV